MYSYINRAITFGDINNKIRHRANPYTCLSCKSAFQAGEFPLLPSLNGFLLCDACYKKSVNSLTEQPFSGGYLVNLLDTVGIDGYAFSHGGALSIRAVGYNSVDEYFLIKQNMCDCGDGYYILPLLTNLNMKNKSELLEYENLRICFTR